MHEWRTSQALADKIAAVTAGAADVTRITIRLGRASHLDETTLRSHLALLTEDSPAANAEIFVVGTGEDDDDHDVVLESVDLIPSPPSAGG